ncbi:MAG: hypothetical protein JOY64_22425 [Alphaproteobacteria bacterium]|nr:hypothetical protein [Alphaproteobacteria bacterium]MBV8410399.1 hypothetical protein [Alphaproteobacteria bacterium]
MRPSRSVAALCGLILFASASTQAQDQRTATPSKGLLWGSKMTVEGGSCCAPIAGAMPGDPGEAKVLASVVDRASRDGPILRLKLQGNRVLKITDCADQDACEADRFRAHRLAAWWPALGTYVVKVGLYEDSLAYLISERDGRTTRVAAVPVLSPSGKRAVALESNLMTGVTLDVIDLSSDPPKVLEVNKMPECKGTGPNSFLRPKPVWTDEQHVRFEGLSPQPDDNPNTKQLLRVGNGALEWEC